MPYSHIATICACGKRFTTKTTQYNHPKSSDNPLKISPVWNGFFKAVSIVGCIWLFNHGTLFYHLYRKPKKIAMKKIAMTICGVALISMMAIAQNDSSLNDLYNQSKSRNENGTYDQNKSTLDQNNLNDNGLQSPLNQSTNPSTIDRAPNTIDGTPRTQDPVSAPQQAQPMQQSDPQSPQLQSQPQLQTQPTTQPQAEPSPLYQTQPRTPVQSPAIPNNPAQQNRLIDPGQPVQSGQPVQPAPQPTTPTGGGMTTLK